MPSNTKAKALAAAGRLLAAARAERDALTITEAAHRAHYPGGPTIEQRETLIAAQRARARHAQSA